MTNRNFQRSHLVYLYSLDAQVSSSTATARTVHVRICGPRGGARLGYKLISMRK